MDDENKKRRPPGSDTERDPNAVDRPKVSINQAKLKRYISQARRFTSHKDNAGDQPKSSYEFIKSTFSSH